MTCLRTLPSTSTESVDQDGSGNVSEVLQDAVGADASVTQDGLDNLSNVDQSDSEATLADPAAIVTQTGDLNTSDVTQNASGVDASDYSRSSQES